MQKPPECSGSLDDAVVVNGNVEYEWIIRAIIVEQFCGCGTGQGEGFCESKTCITLNLLLVC